MILKIAKKVKNTFERMGLKPLNRGFSGENAQYTDQNASDLIKSFIENKNPCMIARFGSVELLAALNFINKDNYKKPIAIIEFLTGIKPYLNLEDDLTTNLINNAGFFPKDSILLERYYKLLIKDMEYVDILGSWMNEEKFFKNNLSKSIKIRLEDIEPYYHKDPWSVLLEGKKVLVVHPFAESIKRQYQKHELLFENKNVLPKFELQTIQAVQSLAGAKTQYANWFDALESMKSKINESDFEIAIIGCGAYGFHLAAHVKRIGKKAVHMGGATQILFGIKGKRWDENERINKLYNNQWVYPDTSEYPENYKIIENGCYWG